jgi:hypothetical protein
MKNTFHKNMEDSKMKNKLIKVFQLVAVALLMCLAVASAETDSVTFKVSVNDWTSHQGSSETKNIANAYVNMYLVRGPFSDSLPFKVYDVVVKNTGSSGVAEFTVLPGQMVYFEGFRTSSAAREGYEQKKLVYWTAPPYKNFGSGKLCQTNYLETEELLGGSEDYACANSLSTPYLAVTSSSSQEETTTVQAPVKERYNDLGIRYWGFGKTAFKAQVCNYGTTDISGFKIKFESNEKENVLTYVPTVTQGNCVLITSWGYSHFGLSESHLKRASIIVDPENEIKERDESNNRGLVFIPLGEVENEQNGGSPQTVPPLPTQSQPTQSTEQPTSAATPSQASAPVKTEVVEPVLPVKCTNGCSYDGSCIPFGTKIKDDDKGPIFCDITGKLLVQKLENQNCQNNYECLSNSCVSGKCLDLEKKLQEQQNLLDKILAWLSRLMGGAN